MYCPFCGVSVPDDATFCPECGNNLEVERVESQSQVSPELKHVAESTPSAPIEQADSQREPAPQPAPQPSPEPAPKSASQRVSTPAPSPQPDPSSAQPEKKRPNKALVIAIAACIVALAVAFFVVPNSIFEPEPPTLTGITTTDVYDNVYFDISIPRTEGFAFANDSEIEQIMGSANDIVRDSGIDEDDNFLDECAYDAMVYDPVVGDMVIVAVIFPEVPRGLSDDEILSACDDGLTRSLSKSDIDTNKSKDDDIQIAGSKCPGIRHTAEISGSSAFIQTALLKTDNHVAIILAFSLSEDRLEEMIAHIAPSTGLEDADTATTDTDEDSDKDEKTTTYEAGTTSGSTYNNPYFGVTLTLPEGFELTDTSDLSGNQDDSVTSAATSGSFATDIVYELAAGNYSTGEYVIVFSQNRPTSYADTYTPEQMAEYAMTHTDKDIFDQQFGTSAGAEAHTEERTYTAAGRDYPGLYTDMKIRGIPASSSLTCIAQGNRVMYISYTSVGEGSFEEFLSRITYDEASKN